MSSRQDRIDKLLTNNFDIFEQPTKPFVDLTTCFDIALNCEDIECDCCGDIKTSNSIESALRVITGSQSNNFLNVRGIDWDLLSKAPLNSTGFREVRNQFTKALSDFPVDITVNYTKQQFEVIIDFPDSNESICVQTLSGEVYKLDGTN